MFSDQNRKCVRPQISLCRQLFFKNGFLHKIKRESHFNSSNGDTKASLTLSRSLKGVLIASILKKLTFRFHEFHEKSYSMAKNRPMCPPPLPLCVELGVYVDILWESKCNIGIEVLAYFLSNLSSLLHYLDLESRERST